MKIISSVFNHNGMIPKIYTCQGKNINPPLEFLHIPEETKSLALIMDDPDVPEWVRKDRMYVHWVIYGIDSSTTKIPEHVKSFAIQGKNTSGTIGYTGPCPPDREHRYFFKLYALDAQLSLLPGLSKEELLIAIEDHILTKAELIGRYEKTKD